MINYHFDLEQKTPILVQRNIAVMLSMNFKEKLL